MSWVPVMTNQRPQTCLSRAGLICDVQAASSIWTQLAPRAAPPRTPSHNKHRKQIWLLSLICSLSERGEANARMRACAAG